ncbi:similar to Saccharomyces cerevisiae YGR149W Putative protein of unknown function [Maudiozyma barnettii]|uniref:Glycerophosphocholine acyltransferase 1 n=1 Tax=Maudiozyma barnettii TaxID=61262 RepID=A0A8H2ZGX0_9SACH|nr:glycerophosphocholine acyltransferase [Kazachstania barnettii]CAB4255084.1 similar to Saccharomyces cerevisiae YGR149W Putative protein of unknown function [Kazachstania barnettii]CAD1783355.1 similar to Saccharomyces cerevisiae YGR149W Putative protein of unknown function [Kazachstania barnettii]
MSSLVNKDDSDDSLISENSPSIFNIFELLDPLASKVAARQLPIFSKRSHNQDNKSEKPSTRSKIYRHYRNGAKIPINELRQKIFKRIKALDQPLDLIFFKNPSVIEKLFYPFTLFNIFAIGYIMGKFPEWFHIYYSIMFGILMPVRFYTYYKTQNHYYMADLCYFVNIMCLVFIWIRSDSIMLFHSCFAFSFGSLAFAVIAWRNSLVLHSIDKTTSCFIHIMPPCTMYIIYYGISESYKLERFPGARKSIDLKTNILWTSLFYLLWQSLYHYFITVRQSSKIKAGKRMTSFEYLTTHQFKNWWVVKLNDPWPAVIYILLQYFYQLSTMLLCSIWLRYKLAASLFLIFIFLCAAHNGATYYIDYYGKAYLDEVMKLRREVGILQQKLDSVNDNEISIDLDDEQRTDHLNVVYNNIGNQRSDVSIRSQSSSILSLDNDKED